MIFQSNNYFCGPAAIVNACLALGHVHDVAEVAQLAGTTAKRGTDENGIKSALLQLEYTVTEINDRAAALWYTIFAVLYRGQSVILCVDGDDHWIAVIGCIGSNESGRLIVFDSERTNENLIDNGVRVYDQADFVDRLGGSSYAIAVGDADTETDSVGNELMNSLTELIGTSATEFSGDRTSEDTTPDVFETLFGDRRR